MKILAIRIKNLASIDGIAEIDFTTEPLCSAGIFAITGPTGAGKSTILDALCLALYGQTPRYKNAEKIDLKDVADNKIGQHDVRGILRDGTGDGYAEVDFVGIDDVKYRSLWKVNRARNKATGAIQHYNVVLTSIDTNQVIAATKTEACKEIERLVGLNYEQFTRSVLLAQGDFTAFLKADKDAKASLLEKLTGTDIYSKISRQVFENHKQAVAKVDRLRTELNSVRLLTDEEIAQHTESISQLQEISKQLDAQLQSINKGLQWHEQFSQLNNSKQRASSELELADKQLQDSASRIKQLHIVEDVQKIRSTVDQWQMASNRLLTNRDAQLVIEQQAKALTGQLAELQKTIATSENILQKAREAGQQAATDLLAATGLDTRIDETTKQLTLKETELKALQGRRDEAEKTLKNTQDELTALNKSLMELRGWQQRHEERKLIAENSTIILSKLQDAQLVLETTQSLENRIQLETTQIEADRQVLTETENAVKQEIIRVDELQKERQSLEQQIEAIDYLKLEQQRKSCDERIQEIGHASITWNILYAELNRKDELTAQQHRLADETTRHTEKLKVVETRLPEAIHQKAAALSRLNKTRIELTKDVTDLRNMLSAGDPCPVCGSIDHPYAKHFPSFENTLSVLEQEYREQEIAVQDLSNEQSSLTTILDKALQEEKRLAGQLDESCKKITEFERRWSSFSVYTDCESLQKEDIEKWLRDFTGQQQTQQRSLTDQISEFNILRNRLNDCIRQFHTQEEALRKLEQRMELLKQQISHNEQGVISVTKQKEEADLNFKDLCAQLTPYFKDDAWVNKWKLNPAEFSKRIETFSKEWLQTVDIIRDYDHRCSLLTSSNGHQVKEVERCNEECDMKRKAVNHFSDELKDIKQKRGKLFDGRPVHEVELMLQKDVQTAERNLNAEKDQYAKLTSDIAAEQARAGQLARLIDDDTKLAEEQISTIEEWMLGFNTRHESSLQLEALLSLLQQDHYWIEQERSAIQLLKDRLTTARATLDEVGRQIADHLKERTTEETVIGLSEKESKSRGQLEQTREELTQRRFRLQEDSDNKRKVGKAQDKLLELQAGADNWAKLNEMIGSADGKKFRQVAQEYTLDVMLKFSNVHLSTLSKRYELQRIPDSLGLQVIDHDMGDEIRTVYSLSGGESFLVSLALALGLASLSSNNIKVESLFIDEGFGSLDPGTLNIVMDALERLHNQGRKVGVISHVQEMKERIMTQIKVTKQSSGKSVITIENGVD